MIACRDRQPVIFICLLLILATAAVYWQVHGFDFVNYDDGDYVSDNSHVQDGITPRSIIWAFTTGHASNWHPVTWMSHMLDCQIFGLWAGGHHLTNLFFHIVNSLLLFLVFRKMTGSIWKSGFVAALFALHPLHVQSVAWVSERKDVLSAFFWMLTLWAYVRYAHQRGWAAYGWVVAFFILGLMSKPMVVTLPFVLLLLDYWPLNRIQLAGPENNLNLKITGLFREKIPLFLLAAISAGITIHVQQQGGAVKSLDVVPLAERLPNVFIAYMNYIIKTVYPVKLAAFYPYPDMFSWWQVTAAALMLAATTWLAIRLRVRSPYVIVGCLWFLGTLVPVIGLVQVGIQSMADRYMYLPMIGLLIIAAWGIPEVVSGWRYKRFWLGAPAIIAVAVLSIVTWKQTGYWKDSISLFSHAINVTENNPLAHYNLGTALSKNGKTDQAIVHFQKAALLDPENKQAQYNLGTLLFKKGDYAQAIPHLEKAVRLDPKNDQSQFNLANTLFQEKKYDDALIHAQEAIALNPGHEKAHQLAGIILFQQGNFTEALAHFNAVLSINPAEAKAHHYSGAIFLKQKQIDKALASFKKALIHDPGNEEDRQLVLRLDAKLTDLEQRLTQGLEKDPDNVVLRKQLGKIYEAQNLDDKAVEQYKLIIRRNPESIDVLYDLAALYADAGEYAMATGYMQQAVSQQPDNPAHDYNMACLYARQNQTGAALSWLKKALDKGYVNWTQIRTDADLKSIRDTTAFKRLVESK